MNETKKHNKHRGHKRKKKRVRVKKKKLIETIWLEMVIALLISIGLCFIVFILFFSVQSFKGISMKPTITNNEKILVKKHFKEIDRFDIVAIKIGNNQEYSRIIGLPGENIKYDNDYLYVNGEVIDEKFLMDQINEAGQKGEVFTQSTRGENGFSTLEIPSEYYLVLGDNRPNANDSRQYGLVSKNQIKGIVVLILSPLKGL